MNPHQQVQDQQHIIKAQHVYQQDGQQYVAATYQRQEFPKWKYHRAKDPVLVKSAEEEASLGAEWKDERVPREANGEAREPEELRRENEELKKQIAALERKELEAVVLPEAKQGAMSPAGRADAIQRGLIREGGG